MDPWTLTKELQERGIDFDLATHREDYIMFKVAVPGERWEIEVSRDGEVEIEVFRRVGHLADASKLQELYDMLAD